MGLLRTAVVAVTVSGVAASGCGGASPESSSSKPNKYSLSTKGAQELGTLAVAKFEKQIAEKGSATIYVFSGVCQLIDDGSIKNNGINADILDVVPDPGFVEATDPRTGDQVTKSIAWDPNQHKYVTGMLSVLGSPSHPGDTRDIATNNAVFNLSSEGSDPRVVPVTFDRAINQFMSNNGIPVMNVYSEAVGKSPAQFGSSELGALVCDSAMASLAPQAQQTT